MPKNESVITPAMEISWSEYLNEHNQRDPDPRVETGVIRSRKRTPPRYFVGASILDKIAGLPTVREYRDGPFTDEPGFEKVFGPALPVEEPGTEMNFLPGLDIFLIELREGDRRILREIGPNRREDLFREIQSFTFDAFGDQIEGRSGQAFVDTRLRVPGGRIFAELLGISERSRHAFKLGALRLFTTAETEGLAEPKTWEQLQAAVEAEEARRRAVTNKRSEELGYSPTELARDRKEMRDRASRQAEIDRAVEAALVKGAE